MACDIYWINSSTNAKLGIMARPRGSDWLEDEITSLLEQGVKVVVSLLEPGEVEEFGLGEEAEICRRHQIEFMSFPIQDRGVPPSGKKFDEFIHLISRSVTDGKTVLIHCRQGIGRAALVGASCLVQMGRSADAAFEMVISARGCEVPDTWEQREWVHAFAERLARVGRGS